MDKKIIFLDIDGTLTEPGSNIPPSSAMDAVNKAKANGHYVYLCTGRNFSMLSPVYSLGFDGAIGSSGGYIVHGDDVIYDCPMSEEERLLVFNTLDNTGIFKTVECKGGAYTDEGFKAFLEANSNQGSNSELLRWRKQIEESLNIRPMSEYNSDDPVYKFILMGSDRELIKSTIEPLRDRFNIVIQDSDKFGITNGELLCNRYDKGQAVHRVCDYLGINISNSYGFGDSMNDLEMIEVVGHSIVMDNGAPALKDIADYVCPAVTEDGLRTAFEKLGLI